MSNLAVNIAVIQAGKILLTQREDFETWILPSGGVEEGESLAQAAIDGATGVVVLQEIQAPNMPRTITREELYERRDSSGLARQEFYLQLVRGAKLREIVEVDGL